MTRLMTYCHITMWVLIAITYVATLPLWITQRGIKMIQFLVEKGENQTARIKLNGVL